MLTKTQKKSALGRLYSRILNKFIFFTFYEQIWGCMFFAFVLLASFIIKKMVNFHLSPLTRDIVFLSRSDWKIVIASGFVNWLVREYFTVLLKEKVKQYLDPVRYKTEEEKENRASIVIKWIIDFIYYSSCTVFAYYILAGQDFIPWQMGGSGECRNSLKDFPNIPEVPGIREYYLIQFGVHLYSFIYQILMKRKDNKFYEYLAHHGFAVMLIGFSYSMNFLLMGSVVLYTHDCSDALLVFARFYGDMKFRNKHLFSFFGVLAFLGWIYTRLYVFPKCVMKVGVEYLIGADYPEKWGDSHRQLTDIPFMYMQSMTMVLLIMHVYWAIFMWKAIFIAITKKKVKIEYEEKEKVNN